MKCPERYKIVQSNRKEYIDNIEKHILVENQDFEECYKDQCTDGDIIINVMKREFLFDIIENEVGKINTSEDYYRESLHSLDDYEYICNSCLEIFRNNLKYKNSIYISDKEIGEKVYKYLVELKDWLNDVVEE